MQSRTLTSSNSELKRSNDLMYFIMINNLDKIKQLNLVNRSNVNNIIDTKSKSSALHYALQLHDNSIINFLLELGADVNQQNSFNKNALDLSLDYHKKSVFDFIIVKKDEIINKLDDECIQLKKKIKLETEIKDYLSKSVDNYKITLRNAQNEIKVINDKKDGLEIENNNLKDQNKTLKRKVDKLNDSIDVLLNSNKK